VNDNGSSLEGFEAPIHRSLTEPILMGGAPRGLAIVNGTLAAALGLASSNGSRGWLPGRSGTRWRSLPRAAIPISRRC
jgi:type IV secretion system protein VirB3